MEEKALVYRLRNPLGFDAFKMGRLPAGLAPTHSTRCRLLSETRFLTRRVSRGRSRRFLTRPGVTRPFDALSLAQGIRPVRRAVACTGHAYPPRLR
jgi:hypothetical protein